MARRRRLIRRPTNFESGSAADALAGPALRGFRASAAGSGVAAGSGAASAPLAARCGEHFRSREMLVLGGEQGVSGSRHHRTEAAGSRLYRSRRPRGYFARRPVTRLGSSSVGSSRPAGVLPHCEDPTVRAGAVPSRPSQTSGATVRMRSQMDGSESARIVETRHNRLPLPLRSHPVWPARGSV